VRAARRVQRERNRKQENSHLELFASVTYGGELMQCMLLLNRLVGNKGMP
jgi:hypothetical protein